MERSVDFLHKGHEPMDETDTRGRSYPQRATVVESTGLVQGVANQFLDRVRRAIAK